MSIVLLMVVTRLRKNIRTKDTKTNHQTKGKRGRKAQRLERQTAVRHKALHDYLLVSFSLITVEKTEPPEQSPEHLGMLISIDPVSN